MYIRVHGYTLMFVYTRWFFVLILTQLVFRVRYYERGGEGFFFCFVIPYFIIIIIILSVYAFA